MADFDDDPARFAGLNRRYRDLYLAARRAQQAGALPGAGAPADPPAGEHLAFRQQVADMLADLDLAEADRQRLLASILCPCCGGTGAAIAIELKTSDAPPRF